MLYTLLTENDADYRDPLNRHYAGHHYHVRSGVWLVSSRDTMVALRDRLCPREPGVPAGRDLVILAVSGWCGHQPDPLRDWLMTTAPASQPTVPPRRLQT